ncbi:Puromycin-sensitive aminopeptidase [Hondaea fermentalgiana]|uniref:Puromycin-sensitive aminopeptidase n=1 Tax=Hondaea fermentalgiana TaxID=2315210 RepID=A0A2R5GXQ2_9STRA|nr:Puromycin-sensitive aminopeptidase [Hondaea fermentalgiana]|eukprot:GBG34568.1 Puromycin-sensitive aminopeptidase [Hondaea fermentalgiana]
MLPDESIIADPNHPASGSLTTLQLQSANAASLGALRTGWQRRATQSSPFRAQRPSKQAESRRTFTSMSEEATQKAAQPVLRLEYEPPAFLAKDVDLTVELDDTSKISCKVEYERQREGADLVLNGERKPAQMEIQSVLINGESLDADAYQVDDETMTIPSAALPVKVGEKISVQIDVTVVPEKNTSLNGLYKSSGNFCTQMEAEGFRNMMYFVDRPDNMSIYRTKVIASKSVPHLLSNGNDVERGDLPDGRHFVLWEDPWPKPCYLFALVGGDFDVLTDSFTTCSGKEVRLGIFVEKGNLSKTPHAMDCLKRAFKWDEERFDREYDLSQFNIVAVSDFTMGAMENKSLNIFNSKYVLADNDTATDTDFLNIEGIIGHEYFHNWSGNRVTCRDWFQLTLKEGLTVFRDQEFSSDLNSRASKRIADVQLLRDHQFKEDAGPMAHPIRPDAYEAIDNFYSLTVYEKGAEIIRMIQTIVTPEGFRKGLNLYFERHDGQAVTCDDFVKAMEDANEVDLSLFRDTWYTQAGTPEVSVKTSYNAEAAELTLTVEQSCPATPGQAEKEPFDIPLAVGLVGTSSNGPLRFKVGAADAEEVDSAVLRVTKAKQEFTLHGVSEKPVPSLLRGFSAPVKLSCSELTRRDLVFLAAHDTDSFVRYESGQELAKQILTELVEKAASGVEADALDHEDAPLLLSSLEHTLRDASLDRALVSLALAMPNESAMADAMEKGTANVDHISSACAALRRLIAEGLGPLFAETYEATREPAKNESPGDAVARRQLKNSCLRYLVKNSALREDALRKAVHQFEAPENMTDRYGAVLAVRDIDCSERTRLLQDFFDMYKSDKLVVQKWFRVQAQSALPSTVDAMKSIMDMPEVFDIKNPNCCYAVFNAFAGGNFTGFHAADGSGYTFVADRIIQIDDINPQVASRLAKQFSSWRSFTAPWSTKMHAELERIAAKKDLSKDVAEIVHKSLEAPSSNL